METKHENYIGAVRKCAVVKKQIEQEHTTGTHNIFSIKRVNRKLKVVSRFSRAKQRQGKVQKKFAAREKLLFC